MAFEDEEITQIIEEKKEDEDEDDPLWNDIDIEDIKKEAQANPIMIEKSRMDTVESKINIASQVLQEEDDAIITIQKHSG